MTDSARNDERRGPFRSLAERLAEGGTSAFVAVFNHLLRQNDWARARLAMFAGRHVSVELETRTLGRLRPPRLAARITDEGLLDTSNRTAGDRPAAGAGSFEATGAGSRDERAYDAQAQASQSGQASPFDVEMHVRPSFAAAGSLMREGTRGLAPYVRVEGEVMLAAALADIAERMRWDPEEDLSRVTGDVFAHRVGRGVAATRDALRELRERFAGSAGRRFARASGTLVGRGELESMRAALDALEARLSGLEANRRRQLAREAASESGEVDPAVPPQLMPPLELPHIDVESGEAQSGSRNAGGAVPSPEADPDGRRRRPDPGAGGSGLA